VGASGTSAGSARAAAEGVLYRVSEGAGEGALDNWLDRVRLERDERFRGSGVPEPAEKEGARRRPTTGVDGEEDVEGKGEEMHSGVRARPRASGGVFWLCGGGSCEVLAMGSSAKGSKRRGFSSMAGTTTWTARRRRGFAGMYEEEGLALVYAGIWRGAACGRLKSNERPAGNFVFQVALWGRRGVWRGCWWGA